MNLVDTVSALLLVPKSRKHILDISKSLKSKSYTELIKQTSGISSTDHNIDVIVKSYFWASRLIAKNNCLPRSIALHQCLIKRGYEVEHKFGVNKQNNMLSAHSWVEYNNLPLNESKDLKLRF